LPRGGRVKVETSTDPAAPSFAVRAQGQGARIQEDAEKAVRGEPTGPLDGRSIQPYLTHKLSRLLNAGLTVVGHDGAIELVAG